MILAGRRRWLMMAFGAVGFVVFGIALLPGLVSHEPRPQPAAVAEPLATGHSARPVAPAAATSAERQEAHAESLRPSVFGRSPAFDCMIAPKEMIDIGSSITGVIDSIPVERSSYVEAGQVVARLESKVEEAAVRVALARADRTVEIDSSRANLALGDRRRSRALDLYNEDSLSLDVREEVETEAQLAALGVVEAEENHRLARLQLEQARAVLDRRTIRSPIAGFVVERLMAPGEVVDEETILRIAKVDPLSVEVILPTHLFGGIRTGDRFEVVPEPPLDAVRTAEVVIVDRLIDGASGTFGVTLELPNPDHDLPGGLRCQARLLQDDEDSDAANGVPASPATPSTP